MLDLLDTVTPVDEAWRFLVEECLIAEQTLTVVTCLNGYTLDTLNDVARCLTGYDVEQLREYMLEVN